MAIRGWMLGTAAAVMVAVAPALAQPGPGPRGDAPRAEGQMRSDGPGRGMQRDGDRGTYGHADRGAYRDREYGMGSRGAGMMQMFRQADADSDGRVTLAELRAEVTRRFQAADADRDGAVTRAEFDAYMASQFEVRGDSQRAQQMRTRLEEMRTRMFRVLDADADGRLTVAEVLQPAELGFRMMDRNGDGAVAQDEVGRRGMQGRGDGPREGRSPGEGPGPQR